MKKSFYALTISAFCLIGCSSEESSNEVLNNSSKTITNNTIAEKENQQYKTNKAIEFLYKQYQSNNTLYSNVVSLENVVKVIETLAVDPSFVEQFNFNAENYSELMPEDLHRIMNKDIVLLQSKEYSRSLLQAVERIVSTDVSSIEEVNQIVLTSQSISEKEKQFLLQLSQNAYEIINIQTGPLGKGKGSGNGSQAGNTGDDWDWFKSNLVGLLHYDNTSSLNIITSSTVLKVVFEQRN